MFNTPNEFLTAINNLGKPDTNSANLARSRQSRLTKPQGALGRLEDVAIWLAGWQRTEFPNADNVQIIVFAGNHGVTKRGVSPYPPEVTQQMVTNFECGGAAINALADTFGFELDIVALDLEHPVNDWTQEPAMSAEECLAAINTGAAAIDTVTDLLVLGEMGIGNTSAAAAIAAATFGGQGADWAGPGTGLDADGVSRKAAIVDEGLARSQDQLTDSFEILRQLGGREIAAIAGALVAAGTHRLPVILDGYVVTAAAATLVKERDDALAHCVAGHLSAEPAHKRLLEKLDLKPLLSLDMRLGEATGAALAANIVRAAAATHSNMATFDEAGVNDRDTP